MEHDGGLETLLLMDGVEHFLDNGYWWKIEAREVEKSKSRPHGIRYCLTFHDNHNTRIFGMDNTHIPKNKRKGYHGRIVKFDHVHKDEKDKGTPYAFVNAEQLLTDFLKRVEEITEQL